MPDHIGVEPDLADDERQSGNSRSALSSSGDSSQDISDIARRISAHGGGAASLDLAFDLVLHGIVEQARAASGATGAAIALSRDGKMVCRATTGENAPDLGVTVDAGSGLTGICLRTGTIQLCLDSESDSGIDAETCRRLGVRSMLLIPLVDVTGAFGVLQLFSSSPNAFGGHETARLLRFADRVAENRKAMLQSEGTGGCSLQTPMPDQPGPRTITRDAKINTDLLQPDSPIGKSYELLTTVLFILVIIAAVSLGIVVGWSNGRKVTTGPRTSVQSNPVSAERDQLTTKAAPQAGASDSRGGHDPSSNFHNEVKSGAVPVGGLVVTENGKVIYRSPEDRAKQSLQQFVSQRGARKLIHRVEPDYPPTARTEHIEGMVVLDVEIAEDGGVANTAVVSGSPLLASAAVEAVRQWQYQPVPGEDSRTRVTLRFTLPVN